MLILQEHTVVLLGEELEVLVNGGDGKEDTGTRTNSTEEVSTDGKCTNAHTTEGSCDGNGAVKKHAGVVLSLNQVTTLSLELSLNISDGSTRDLDPSLGEEGTGEQDESDVEDSVDRISQHGPERLRRRNVVSKTTDRDRVAAATVLPYTKNANKKVGGEALVDKLREEVEVGDESSLKDDGNVGSVEQLDGVRCNETTLILDLELDTETLEVNNDQEHHNSCDEVSQVREVRAVESLEKSRELVGTNVKKVEESDDCALEFRAVRTSDSNWREGLPNDSLANVRSNEDRDSRADTPTDLKELIKQQNDDAGNEQLEDDQDSITSTNLLDVTVHAGENVSDGLTQSDEDTKDLLSRSEELALLLVRLVNLKDTRAGQELHDNTGGDNGGNTELHQSTTVGSEDDTNPVEGIRG